MKTELKNSEIVTNLPVKGIVGRISGCKLNRTENGESYYVIFVIKSATGESVVFTISQKRVDALGLGSIIREQVDENGNRLEFKPVTRYFRVVEIPNDGQTYGYHDRATGEDVAYHKQEGFILLGIDKPTDESKIQDFEVLELANLANLQKVKTLFLTMRGKPYVYGASAEDDEFFLNLASRLM